MYAQIADYPTWDHYSLAIGEVAFISSIPGHQPVDVKTRSFTTWAQGQVGNWGAIVRTDDTVALITDGPRSFPLLYTKVDDKLIISRDPTALLAELPNPRRHAQAAAQFRHAGFVLGTDTLIDGVSNVPCGTIVTISADSFDTCTWEPYVVAPDPDIQVEDVLPVFDELIMDTVAKFLDRIDGRQILIPLSGGADSRLFLALLHRLGADNVMTFTYGKRNTREPEISREVAHALGYPWKFVELDANRMRAAWKRPETTQFLKDTWTGLALPHIQDWYALSVLVDDPEISSQAVVTPGHTIVGNIHDDWCFNPEISIDFRAMTRILANKHLALQGHPEYGTQVAYARDKITGFLRRWWPEEDPTMRTGVVVGFNIAERQAKYITNSVRAYEAFGLNWALPMLEHPIQEYWLKAPLEFKDARRSHYVQYCYEMHAKAAGVEVKYFTGPANQIPQGPMNLARTVLEKLNLKQQVEHLYRALVELRHPMGYEALVGDVSRPELAAKLLGGASIIGVYCDLFLANQWTPGGDVVPRG